MGLGVGQERRGIMRPMSDGGWPDHRLSSWQEFATFVVQTTAEGHGRQKYLFRGQSQKDWDLSPSLLRWCPGHFMTDAMLEVERQAGQDFARHAHRFPEASILPPPGLAIEQMQLWALMQHHGAPTRLLDWTRSGYVAAYFAVAEHLDEDGAVYALHVDLYEHESSREFGWASDLKREVWTLATSPGRVLVAEPERSTERMMAQQGVFTVSTNVQTRHGDEIARVCSRVEAANTIVFRKWVIPAGKKMEFMRQLKQMNIGAHSLFPGSDGLGRSVRESVIAGLRG